MTQWHKTAYADNNQPRRQTFLFGNLKFIAQKWCTCDISAMRVEITQWMNNTPAPSLSKWCYLSVNYCLSCGNCDSILYIYATSTRKSSRQQCQNMESFYIYYTNIIYNLMPFKSILWQISAYVYNVFSIQNYVFSDELPYNIHHAMPTKNISARGKLKFLPVAWNN